MNTPVHPAAGQGFAQEAAAYARGRPDYPPALEGWLRDTLGLGPGCLAVDVGAGTGKFTPRLLATGATVVAVEPVDAMRARLARALPEVQALAGSAQALPLADASADAIVCAQAFHWFASHAVLQEFHRVLKPGGRLGLVWNVRDETVDWVAEITRIITPHEGDAPRFHKGDWRRPFDEGPQHWFGPLAELQWPYAHHGPAQQVVVDRFLSVSFIASLPNAGKHDVRHQLERLLATHPALRGRTELALPYVTRALWARRLPPPARLTRAQAHPLDPAAP